MFIVRRVANENFQYKAPSLVTRSIMPFVIIIELLASDNMWPRTTNIIWNFVFDIISYVLKHAWVRWVVWFQIRMPFVAPKWNGSPHMHSEYLDSWYLYTLDLYCNSYNSEKEKFIGCACHWAFIMSIFFKIISFYIELDVQR